MYVRWQRRARSKRRAYGMPEGRAVLLVAHIVESTRIEGKPRQHTVAYLGSIREDFCSADAHPYRRARFWKEISAKLDALNLPSDTRNQIEAKLGAKVERPDPDTAAKAEEEFEQWKAGMRGMLKAMAQRQR